MPATRSFEGAVRVSRVTVAALYALDVEGAMNGAMCAACKGVDGASVCA